LSGKGLTCFAPNGLTNGRGRRATFQRFGAGAVQGGLRFNVSRRCGCGHLHSGYGSLDCSATVGFGEARLISLIASTPSTRDLQRINQGLPPSPRTGASVCNALLDLQETSPARRPFVADHYVPRSLGGGDHAGNLRAAHKSCNARRSNKLPPELWVQWL
jgi:hypothetical protein